MDFNIWALCKLRIRGRGCRGDLSVESCSSCIHSELLGMYTDAESERPQKGLVEYGGGYCWSDLQRALQRFGDARQGRP